MRFTTNRPGALALIALAAMPIPGAVLAQEQTATDPQIVVTGTPIPDPATMAEGPEIKGTITSVDTTAGTFVVDGKTVNHASARFEDGSAADLRVGARVEVKGSAPVAGVVTATEVEFDD